MGKELAQTKNTGKYSEKSKRMASPMASYEDRLKAVLSRKSQLEENRLSMTRQRILENALKHEKLLAERKKDLETRNQTNTSRIAAVLKRREQILMENHARKVEILRKVELKCIKAAEIKSKSKGKVSKRKTSLSQAIFHQLELPVNKYKHKICTMPKTMPTPKRLVNTSKTVAPKSPNTMSPKRKIRSASGSRLQNQVSSTAAAMTDTQKSKTLGRPKKNQSSCMARELHPKKELPIVTASEATPRRKSSATKQEPLSQEKSSAAKEKDANSEIEFYKQKMAEHRRAMRDKMNANKAAQQPAKVKAPLSAAEAVTAVGSLVPGLVAAGIKPETDQLDRSINDLLSIANTEVGRLNTLPDTNKMGSKIGTPGKEEKPMLAVGPFGSKQSLVDNVPAKDDELDFTRSAIDLSGTKETPIQSVKKAKADVEDEDKEKAQEDQSLKLFEKEEQMMIEQEKEKQKLEDEREKQRIEAEKLRLKEQEEFERLQEERRKAEEEERAERRARLEAIMKRTRSASVAKSSSPAPTSKIEPKEIPAEPQPEVKPGPVPPQTQTAPKEDSDQRNESEATAKGIAKEYSREHSVSPEPVMECAQAILTPTEEGVRSANLNTVHPKVVEALSENNASKDNTGNWGGPAPVLNDLDPLATSSGGVSGEGTEFSGLEDSGISLASDDLLSGLSQISLNTSVDESQSNFLEGLDFQSANLLANNSATNFCAKESPLPAMQFLSPVLKNGGSLLDDSSKVANGVPLGLIDLEESPRAEKEGPEEEGTSLRASNEESLSKSLEESSVEHAA